MILACPLCHTRYLVAANLLNGQPRMVRCGRCQHNWRAEPGEAARSGSTGAKDTPSFAALSDLPPILLQTAPSAMPDDVLAGLLMHWWKYGALAVLAVVVGWLVLDRQDLAQTRPSIEKIYNRLGLRIYHYHGEGLIFDQVRSELHFEGGLMKLTVEGKVRNGTEFEEEIPDILASAIGPDGEVMQSWQIDAPAPNVQGGQSIPFKSAITSPKGTVVDLNLSFIEIKTPHE